MAGQVKHGRGVETTNWFFHDCELTPCKIVALRNRGAGSRGKPRMWAGGICVCPSYRRVAVTYGLKRQRLRPGLSRPAPEALPCQKEPTCTCKRQQKKSRFRHNSKARLFALCLLLQLRELALGGFLELLALGLVPAQTCAQARRAFTVLCFASESPGVRLSVQQGLLLLDLKLAPFWREATQLQPGCHLLQCQTEPRALRSTGEGANKTQGLRAPTDSFAGLPWHGAHPGQDIPEDTAEADKPRPLPCAPKIPTLRARGRLPPMLLCQLSYSLAKFALEASDVSLLTPPRPQSLRV